MEKYALPHIADFVPAFKPVDLQTGNNNGLWFSMKDTDGVNVLFWKAIGTAGDNPVINLQQATDASGTGAKTLQLKRVFYKLGSGAIAAATDQWVKVTSIDPFANPADSYSTAGITAAANEFIFCAHVVATDFDMANGYRYLRIQVPDTGTNAQLGCAAYIPLGLKYKGLPLASRLA